MKIPFLFGIHCHQPADNFSYVVDSAIMKSYSPFLKAALKNKKFKFSAHYSGWLLEYIRLNHKDTFDSLKKLASTNQIEFFTGGFYEPILSAIPSADRIGQIKMLSDYLMNHFGVKSPDGIWLTERVWDPAIVPDIASLGIKNVIIDDYHLLAAGFPKASITGYFKTEQDGYGVNLFPIDMGLRYLIPFKEITEVKNHIISAKNSGTKLIACFDDGEKFGVWPKTYEHVYKEKWLEGFINTITSSDEIEFMHYADIESLGIKPAGSAYLPVTSYEEMGEWSLFADMYEQFEETKEYLANSKYKNNIRQFLKGSIWKNFLVKYPESNRLHKRVLDLSKRAKDYKSDKKFIDALYKAQCNDSLWHGIFGGLYLPNLRDNTWGALIEAEAIYEKLSGTQIPSIAIYDMDLDGYDEVYARTKFFNMLFVSRDFGQLTAIELKKEKFNILNIISRKKEGYHARYAANASKETKSGDAESIHEKVYIIPENVQKHIAYDWYNKNCFIDHFTDKFDLDSFESCSFKELGDFANQGAGSVKTEKDTIIFSRDGGLFYNGVKTNVSMTKHYKISETGIDFEVSINSYNELSCDYFMEFNFHFAELDYVKINDKALTERGCIKSTFINLYDDFTKKNVTISFDNPADISWFKLYTVSQSEAGIDLTAQGLSIAFSLPYNKNMTICGKLIIE